MLETYTVTNYFSFIATAVMLIIEFVFDKPWVCMGWKWRLGRQGTVRVQNDILITLIYLPVLWMWWEDGLLSRWVVSSAKLTKSPSNSLSMLLTRKEKEM